MQLSIQVLVFETSTCGMLSVLDDALDLEYPENIPTLYQEYQRKLQESLNSIGRITPVTAFLMAAVGEQPLPPKMMKSQSVLKLFKG